MLLLYTIIGLFLFAVEFSRLVVAYSGTFITVNDAKVTTIENDYFDPWSIEVFPTKKNSLVNIKMPTKKQLPDTMEFIIIMSLHGQEPFEYSMNICDALNDEVIGKKFASYGRPIDEFPKQCPFLPGDWLIEKAEPLSELVPPGVPDGPITGSIMMKEEGKEPCVKIDYTATISNSFPGIGR